MRMFPKALTMLLVAAVVPMVVAMPAECYQEGTVADGGSIAGKVVFKGAVPMRTVVPTKDKEVCGGTREEPLIVVGADGGVRYAVAYLKDVGKGKAWEKPAKPYEITNDKCRFVPHVQAVPVNSEIAILNDDPMLHNTHSFLDNKTVFNVALPFKGAKVVRPLNKGGVVRVDCDVHGWMRAWIFVADNPYYSITGEDGSFAIKDVPPGNYTLVIWQEQTGMLERAVSVKAKQTTNVGTVEIK